MFELFFLFLLDWQPRFVPEPPLPIPNPDTFSWAAPKPSATNESYSLLEAKPQPDWTCRYLATAGASWIGNCDLASARAGEWRGPSTAELAAVEGAWRVEEVSEEVATALGVTPHDHVWLGARSMFIDGAILQAPLQPCLKSNHEQVFHWGPYDPNGFSPAFKMGFGRGREVYFIPSPGHEHVHRHGTLWFVEYGGWVWGHHGGYYATGRWHSLTIARMP